MKLFTYIGLVVTKYVQTKPLFIMSYAILHITQGLSQSAYQAATYSVLTILFPSDVNYVVACYETANGLGFSFGPALGSLMFSYGGYELPFLVLSVIIAFSLVVAKLYIPLFVNFSITETSSSTKEVPMHNVLTNKRMIFAC